MASRSWRPQLIFKKYWLWEGCRSGIPLYFADRVGIFESHAVSILDNGTSGCDRQHMVTYVAECRGMELERQAQRHDERGPRLKNRVQIVENCNDQPRVPLAPLHGQDWNYEPTS